MTNKRLEMKKYTVITVVIITTETGWDGTLLSWNRSLSHPRERLFLCRFNKWMQEENENRSNL